MTLEPMSATAARRTRGRERQRLFDLAGKVALVTGGSRGIGRATAIALATQGADVAISCVEHARNAMDTSEGIEELGRRSLVVEMDVADRSQVESALGAVTQELGDIDIVVNNAGIMTLSPFLEMSEKTWDRVIEVNLKGQFLVAQAVARRMVERERGGRIINVASIGSGGVGVGFPGIAHYAASKGGVIALTETMAIELAQYGITVNAIAPGVIETDMTRELLMSPATREALLRRIPLQRPGRPEEVAALIAFVASAEASYCTGETFYVDGGWLAE